MRCLFLNTLVLLSAVSIRTSAQACLGNASFASGPANLGAGMSVSDEVKSYGLSLAVGAPAGPFASTSLSRHEIDGIDAAGASISGSLGFAADLTPTKAFQFCPLVGFGYTSGPNFSTPIGRATWSDHAVWFGGASGGIITVSPSLDFIPFVTANYLMRRGTGSIAGASETTSQDYVSIDIGAGFVLNRVLTIGPSVSIPVGVEDGSSNFNLGFSFNFGGSKSGKKQADGAADRE